MSVNGVARFFSFTFIGKPCRSDTCIVNVVSVAETTLPVSASVNGVPTFAKNSSC